MKNKILYKVLSVISFVFITVLSTSASAVPQSNQPCVKQSVFIGDWTVTKVDFPDNYWGEIKYPVSFQLTATNNQSSVTNTTKELKLKGTYKDQFDHQFDFSLVELINNGNELLLLTYGTTKHSESWAPLHKVKFINGQLVGAVITKTQRFIWYAEPTKE